MIKSLKCQKGFSIAEMMITVAIIGLLASIAIPNYSLSVVRTRQNEAKNALAAMYTAEKTFFVEKGSYTYCLVQAGYLPDSGAQKYYAQGFWASGSITCGPQGNLNCFTYNFSYLTCNGTTSPGCCSTAVIPWGTSIRNDASFGANLWANVALKGLAPAGLSTFPTNTTFTLDTYGSIDSSNPNFDVWEIDQNSNLTNPTSGL